MNRKYLYLIAVVVLALSSCSKDDDGNDGPDIRPYRPNTRYLTRIEVPKTLTSGTQFIEHSTLIGKDSVMTFCLEYDLTRFHSRWVAFRFDGLTRGINVPRQDLWADDPSLSEKYHIGSGTFRGGVRGHICASHDRRYSEEANRQTFYMTNMTPMNYDFNSDYWSKFENHIQTLGRSTTFSDTLYIVKGGAIYDDEVKGWAYSSMGKAMPIPRHYFIAALKLKAGKYSAIGFWVEHKDDGSSASTSTLRSAACKISQLEERTGIDFFPNLPDNIEQQVESTLTYTDWNL